MKNINLEALPGDVVYIKDLEVKATVCSITIMESGFLKYDIRYWMNGEQKFASVSLSELK